jgi:hypothetical protein
LCQIAMQETGGGYDQFASKTLYGISALWPLENGATSTVPSGTYIGLMQVPVSLGTAFNWLTNTVKGNSVFEEKIGNVLSYQKQQIAKNPNLPEMSGQEIEDSALTFYGGFTNPGKKTRLHYYIPGTVGGQPNWVLNPSDSVISSEGISATQYIYGGGGVVGVRNWQPPD